MSDRMNEDRCSCCSRGGGFGRLFKTLLSLLFLYVALVFGGGTLINTGHPVAVEVGRIIQIATFVEPTINWAASNGHYMLAGAIERLAAGVEVG